MHSYHHHHHPKSWQTSIIKLFHNPSQMWLKRTAITFQNNFGQLDEISTVNSMLTVFNIWKSLEGQKKFIDFICRLYFDDMRIASAGDWLVYKRWCKFSLGFCFSIFKRYSLPQIWACKYLFIFIISSCHKIGICFLGLFEEI